LKNFRRTKLDSRKRRRNFREHPSLKSMPLFMTDATDLAAKIKLMTCTHPHFCSQKLKSLSLLSLKM
jgi:hypothetical protein